MAATRPPLYAEPELVVRRDPEPVASAPAVAVEPALEVVLTHQLEVVETGAFARAVCTSCDWVGPARRSRAVATADAERHP